MLVFFSSHLPCRVIRFLRGRSLECIPYIRTFVVGVLTFSRWIEASWASMSSSSSSSSDWWPLFLRTSEYIVWISQGSLMVIFCAFVVNLSKKQPNEHNFTARMIARQRTVSTILQCFDFNASTTVTTGILCMFPYVLPGKICSETINLPAIMPNEKDEIFSWKIACASPRS